MRLFLNNSNKAFEKKDISKRCRVRPENVQVELNILKSVGMIKSIRFFKESEKGKKKRVSGWILNTDFQYIFQLKDLISNTNLFTLKELRKRFKNAGSVKLLAVSGVFLRNEDSQIDLLMAGDNLKKKIIDDVVKDMEAELGNEITYAVFDTKEFLYRFDMHDKLVADILDFPHMCVVDTLKIES